MTESEVMAKRGPKGPNSTSFKKGSSGNPGGLTKDQREARDWIRDSLKGERDAVHAALIELVNNGNPQAIIYAHQVLHGKEPDRSELSIKNDSGELLKGLTPDGIASLVSGLEDHRRALGDGEGQGVGDRRALVSSGPKPDGAASGLMGKS